MRKLVSAGLNRYSTILSATNYKLTQYLPHLIYNVHEDRTEILRWMFNFCEISCSYIRVYCNRSNFGTLMRLLQPMGLETTVSARIVGINLPSEDAGAALQAA